MKRRFLFTLVANLAIFVALLGVRPTSWLAWYQPEALRELLK
jgi:cyclic lactone autoinducer peptide